MSEDAARLLTFLRISMHSPTVWPLLLALLALPAPVLADIAPEPLAGLSEPRPLDATAAKGISMKHEEVIIELHDAYALIDATFTLPGRTSTRSRR